MQVAKNVDLERFMGDWYVIANIPTIFERDAVNPLESYSRNPDGTIPQRFPSALDLVFQCYRYIHPSGLPCCFHSKNGHQ